MSARDTRSVERSPEEIRREIERTRATMDRTVEAIGDKLSPGRLLDELWLRVRSSGGRATLGASVREHPLPIALVGVGLGWLALERLRGRHDDVGEGTYGRAEGRVGPYRGDAVDRDDPDWAHASAGTRLKAKASGAAHAVGDAAHAVRETLSDAADSARAATSGLKESPLALGAIAFGLGLAGGVSAPSSQWEDETLGRYAGPLKGEARQAVKETAGKAKTVAGAALDAAREELQRRRKDLMASDSFRQVVEQVKDSARAVGRTVQETAREVARSEELTGAGLGRTARRVRERAGEVARD